MQDEGRSSTLLKDYEQANEQIDKADQVDVETTRRPIRDCPQMIDVCVIGSGLYRVRGTFDQVMNLSTNAGLVQIYLNILSIAYLLALRAAGDFFADLLRHADRNQAIAGNHLRSGAGGIWLDCFGDNSLRCIDPGYSIPRRWLVTQTL